MQLPKWEYTWELLGSIPCILPHLWKNVSHLNTFSWPHGPCIPHLIKNPMLDNKLYCLPYCHGRFWRSMSILTFYIYLHINEKIKGCSDIEKGDNIVFAPFVQLKKNCPRIYSSNMYTLWRNNSILTDNGWWKKHHIRILTNIQNPPLLSIQICNKIY
jgi:hypothetical protein